MLTHRYGITVDDYRRMFREQNIFAPSVARISGKRAPQRSLLS